LRFFRKAQNTLYSLISILLMHPLTWTTSLVKPI